MPNEKVYASDGVDVEEESSFSSFAGSICRESYENSPFIEVHDFSKGSFRGPRPFSLRNLPEGVFIESSADGIGTKSILIDAAQTYKLAAYDIIAMTASDITRFGGVPMVFTNILDVDSVGKEGDQVSAAYKSVIEGLGEVAKEGKLVLLKGETAQMSICLSSEIENSKTKFNWSGVMIGAFHEEKMITGQSLAEGQVVVALKENGFRCNGISSVRSAFRKKFGERWWEVPQAGNYIRQAAEPSVLYDYFVNTLHGWFNKDFRPEINIRSVIHLSGGAIKEKLANDLLFPRGLSSELEDLWDPPDIMKKCAEWRGISDQEFYEVWNGGQGMLLVVDEKDAEYCVKRARDFGISAKVAGVINKNDKPRVSVVSKLVFGNKIIYS